MAKNSLPPSGDVPAGQVKTCDASGMAMIHRVFRAGYGEAPDLVRGVREGDTTHARVVVDHIPMLSVGLHAHHDGEDERLWPVLDQRAPVVRPACVAHEGSASGDPDPFQRDQLASALPAWRFSVSAADAPPVLDALTGVNEALAVHRHRRGSHDRAVMEYTITEAEIRWFSEHGRKAPPKAYRWQNLGMVLSAQPDGGERSSKKNCRHPCGSSGDGSAR